MPDEAPQDQLLIATSFERALARELPDEAVGSLMVTLGAEHAGFEKPLARYALPTIDLYQIEKSVIGRDEPASAAPPALR